MRPRQHRIFSRGRRDHYRFAKHLLERNAFFPIVPPRDRGDRPPRYRLGKSQAPERESNFLESIQLGCSFGTTRALARRCRQLALAKVPPALDHAPPESLLGP
jgi:hypothetical protein